MKKTEKLQKIKKIIENYLNGYYGPIDTNIENLSGYEVSLIADTLAYDIKRVLEA